MPTVLHVLCRFTQQTSISLPHASVQRISLLFSGQRPWLNVVGTHCDAVTGQSHPLSGHSTSPTHKVSSTTLHSGLENPLSAHHSGGTLKMKTQILLSQKNTRRYQSSSTSHIPKLLPAAFHSSVGNQLSAHDISRTLTKKAQILLSPKKRRRHQSTSTSRIHKLTSTAFHSSAGSQLTAHNRSRTLTKNTRIPLSQKEEIEQVVEENWATIAEYASVLGCGESMVADMVRADTRLVTQFSTERVKAKMRLLTEYGFAAEEIASRYQVLSRSYEVLQARLQAMEPTRRFRRNLATLILSDAQFSSRMDAYRKEVAVMADHLSQASFMADLLECTEEEIVALADRKKYEFLLTMPPSRLKEVINLLRSVGISLAEMREKPLMLKCLPDLARERLRRVEEAGVFDLDLVPYILTNSDSNFDSSFDSWVRNAAAIEGYKDTQELLMHRLDCSEKEFNAMMTRAPNIATLSPYKLKSCLDVLQEELGLSSSAILQCGELLYFSPARLRSRWVVLKGLKLTEAELVKALLLSKRKYEAKYWDGSDL